MSNFWYDNAIVYHIYPLGFCGAPKYNEGGEVQYRLNKLVDWIPHLKEMLTLFILVLYLNLLNTAMIPLTTKLLTDVWATTLHLKTFAVSFMRTVLKLYWTAFLITLEEALISSRISSKTVRILLTADGFII